MDLYKFEGTPLPLPKKMMELPSFSVNFLPTGMHGHLSVEISKTFSDDSEYQVRIQNYVATGPMTPEQAIAFSSTLAAAAEYAQDIERDYLPELKRYKEKHKS